MKTQYPQRTSRDFKKGEIVYDSSNKGYGIVIWKADPIEYNSDLYELRLDSDGMQLTENLRKLGEAGDVGTKKQLFDAVSSYERLRQEWSSMNYPEIINNPYF